MLWPEMAGHVGDDASGITVEARFGESIFVKVRWFVVIRSSKDACTCLPIQTYGRRGVTKPGLLARDHAPLVAKDQTEQLLPGEVGLRPALHAILEGSETIDHRARINFHKVYTIEYNCKVCGVGRIAPEDVPLLRKHFAETWDRKNSYSYLYVIHLRLTKEIVAHLVDDEEQDAAVSNEPKQPYIDKDEAGGQQQASQASSLLGEMNRVKTEIKQNELSVLDKAVHQKLQTLQQLDAEMLQKQLQLKDQTEKLMKLEGKLSAFDMWSCHECGSGPFVGTTTPACANCGHSRCTNC